MRPSKGTHTFLPTGHIRTSRVVPGNVRTLQELKSYTTGQKPEIVDAARPGGRRLGQNEVTLPLTAGRQSVARRGGF
jgi:hypothetical protein